jgi:hypothetical protein
MLFQAERLSQSKKVVLSICVSFIHIFCYLNLEEKNTKLKIGTTAPNITTFFPSGKLSV